MRVAWIPPHFEYGERVFFPYSFDIARRLAQRGVKVVIIAPRAFKEPSYEVIEGIEIFRSKDIALPFKLFHYPIPLLLSTKIIHVVRELDIDVLNWHGYHYLSAATLPLIKRNLKIPCVLTVIGFPGVTWHYPIKTIDYITRMYAYSIGKIILNSADKVIIDFPHNTDGARKLGLRDDKLEYIPLGIDTQFFKPIPEKRSEMRSHLGLKEDHFVIGYCGRLSPVKGIDTIFKAMQLIINRYDKVHLLIIGGGGSGLGGDAYAKEAHTLLGDKVTITGWMTTNDVLFYMQAADVAVQPSFAEAGGGAVMEWSACGLSVIASRTGGLQDLVMDNITGFLIEPGDSEGLSQRIMELIENQSLRKEMGEAGRNRMVENYSWDEIVEKYLKVYSNLIQK